MLNQHTEKLTILGARGVKKVKLILSILKKAAHGFLDDNVTKYAGSLSYTIIFSLGPLLLMIIALGSIFLGKEAVEGQLIDQFSGFVGAEAALQIQEVIKNASLAGKSTVSFIIGLVILLIGSTALFAEIQSSVNAIWRLKPQPKKGWLKFLKNRFLSFSVVISLGFLLLVSLGINAIVDAISDRLIAQFPEAGLVVFYIINLLITFGITAFIFGVIFKVLPDADIKWKHVRAGAIATAILFMLGKFLISFYIGQGTIGSAFGAASSLIVLLTWVYYSALILYFGAEFTKFYALAYGDKIHPSEYAISTKIVEIERDSMDTDGEKVVVKQADNKEIEEKLEELPHENEDGLSIKNHIT